MPQWYYTTDGQQAGPVVLSELQQLLAGGQVKSSDMVWREGMANWQYPHAVAELSTSNAGAPAPYAPAPYAPAPYAPAPYGATPAAGAAPAYGQYAQPGYQQAGYAPPVPGAGPAVPTVNYYTPAPYSPQWMAARPYAGFWLRFGAAFIDGLIVGVPLYGVEFALIFGAGLSPDSPGVMPLLDLVNILVLWLYSALLESSPRQATLGKRVCGIRVTDLSGQRITFGRASGRHFGKILSAMICYIGFIMAGFTERKQALHDMMANTLVIT